MVAGMLSSLNKTQLPFHAHTPLTDSSNEAKPIVYHTQVQPLNHPPGGGVCSPALSVPAAPNQRERPTSQPQIFFSHRPLL